MAVRGKWLFLLHASVKLSIFAVWISLVWSAAPSHFALCGWWGGNIYRGGLCSRSHTRALLPKEFSSYSYNTAEVLNWISAVFFFGWVLLYWIAIILKSLRYETSNLTRSMKIISLCGRLCDSQGIEFNGMRDEKCNLSHWDEIMSDVFWKKSNVFGWNFDETNTKCHENRDLLP